MGAITVTGLGKAYKQYPGRWSRLAEWVMPWRGPRHALHWVLRDVSFRVEPGEAVGIIGINGAGKSTLLKLITGTTKPTTGDVQITGRVAALLELGMGFHPDFTGRQNVVMAGQLLGLNVEEIAALMPEIEAFAEIGEYIDQPVRVYSSGMQMRLAFSVATARRPDVLIVDEALSVGDAFFQQKCFDRIREFRDRGTTLLFVSHAMGTVYALCSRAALLDGGRVVLDGRPKEVIDLYNARLAAAHSRVAPRVREPDRPLAGEFPAEAALTTDPPAAPAVEPVAPSAAAVGSYFSDGVEIESVCLLCDGREVAAAVADSVVTARVRVRFRRAYADPHVGFQFRNSRGEALYMTTTAALRRPLGAVVYGCLVEVDFFFRLAVAEGEYTVTAGVADGALPEGPFRAALARLHDVAALTVVRNVAAARWAGVVNLAPECAVRRPTDAPAVGLAR